MKGTVGEGCTVGTETEKEGERERERRERATVSKRGKDRVRLS